MEMLYHLLTASYSVPMGSAFGAEMQSIRKCSKCLCSGALSSLSCLLMEHGDNDVLDVVGIVPVPPRVFLLPVFSSTW